MNASVYGTVVFLLAPLRWSPRLLSRGDNYADTGGLLPRLCAPLAYLHGCGLVHRDLKPGNIFIQQDGRVVLGDFGVAVEFGGAYGREVLNVDAGGVGTALYMAPEQSRGDFVDARADLYSLGCVLYECVTGFPPFIGSSSRAIRRRHLQEPVNPPSQLLGEPLPARLEWLILKLLEKRPEDRLGYAEDVSRVLLELGVESESPARLPKPRTYLYRPLFTGRKEAVERIRSQLDELAHGGGGRIFIGGGSGIGKTRLAMEMAHEAVGRELSVVTCECIPLGLSGSKVDASMKAPPFHPLRSLLAAVVDRCRRWGAEETTRLLGPKGKVLVTYEPVLDELPGQQALPRPRPLASAEAARARIFTSLQEVLFSFAEEDPLLLIIDDLQWADEMTLGFLHSLRQEELSTRGVLVLATYRMEQQEEALRQLVSLPEALHLKLGRLDDESIQALACGMLALQSLPGDFDALVHQAEGNPFFVAEYLRAVIVEGLLDRDARGQWRLKAGDGAGLSLGTIALPVSIAEIIHRRLSDLDSRTRMLVELAAVLGREFDAELLLATAPLTEVESLESLETLRIRQILEEAAGGRLRFVHDKLREVSYAGISTERCRAFHHRAAESILRRYGQTRELVLLYPTLAHHWAKAQVHDQASRYFGLAGDRARAAHANGEAILFYREALAEAREHLGNEGEPESWRPALLHLHESLGDLLALTGKQEEARTAYGEALARLPVTQGLRQAGVHRKLGKTWNTHHRHEDALRAFDEAEASLGKPPSEDPAAAPEVTDWWQEWVQLQVDRNWIYYWLGQIEAMGTLVKKVRHVVESKGTPLQLARFYPSVIIMMLRRDRYQVSDELVEVGRKVVEASEACGELPEQVMARFLRAFTLLYHGDFATAEQEGLIGLRLAERVGDLTLQSRLLTYLTQTYRQQGDLNRTRECAERSLALAMSIRMEDYVGAARAHLAWVAWREQRMDVAEQEAQAALGCWRKLSEVYPYPGQCQGLWVLVALALRREDVAEAVEHARAMLDPALQWLPDLLVANLATAIDAWNQGRLEEARKSLEQATDSAERLKYL
ncbi:ATP-binding protein [Corallococcus terminator]|uniref:Serine/threonine-protein kinase PknK n=1 Tax=Corallococcus terminator TaxID=2316733 RepID=A0A3A8JD44_9BACT|nr:AAA family ATPase [Corallococcus terminator]RKG88421.1 serine/threonine-protein kinase PknK [Corallococcus terminator]